MKTIDPAHVVPGAEKSVVGPKINAHRLDEKGREIVDSRPLAPPIGFVPQESIFDQMRAMMRAASLEAAQAGAETLEEANDFYVEDDPASGVPPSEYEFDEDHQTELDEIIRRNSSPRSEGGEIPGEAEPPSAKAKNKPKTPPEPSDGGSEGGE